jgi:hypothetical protein
MNDLLIAWFTVVLLCRSMLNFNNASWFLSTPRHLSAPHWPIQLTATLSVLYYFLVNPHGYLPYAGVTINEGKWALIVICILTNSVWNLLGVSQLLSYGATQANEQVVLKRAAVAPARRESNGASSTTLRQPIVQSNEEPEDVSAGDSPAPRSRKSTTRSSRSSSRKKA